MNGDREPIPCNNANDDKTTEVICVPAIIRYSAKAALLFGGGVSAVVHSAYEGTINLQTQSSLFSVQPAALPQTPMSIHVDCSLEQFASLRVLRGDIVRFSREQMLLAGAPFSAAGARKWNPDISLLYQGNQDVSSALVGQLRLLLEKRRGEDGFAAAALLPEHPSPGSVEAIAANAIGQIYRYGKAGCYNDAAQIAAGLVGLGPGLTPSGDDFNVGLLAALFFLGGCPESRKFRESLSLHLQKNLPATNDISAQFLKHAVCGEFSEVIGCIFCAEKRQINLSRALETAAAMGHSSGADTLGGMLAGFCALGKGNQDNSALAIAK